MIGVFDGHEKAGNPAPHGRGILRFYGDLEDIRLKQAGTILSHDRGHDVFLGREISIQLRNRDFGCLGNSCDPGRVEAAFDKQRPRRCDHPPASLLSSQFP